MVVSYFFHGAETAVSHNYSVSRDNQKIVSGSQKLFRDLHKPTFGNAVMWQPACRFNCPGLGGNEGSQ
jgi:hypothetical protein